MEEGKRTIYPSRLNRGFDSKFPDGYDDKHLKKAITAETLSIITKMSMLV